MKWVQGTDHRPENTANLPGQYPLVKFCLFFSRSFRDDLHQPVATYTRQVKQEFYKYPKPDYNFNYVDQLISGDQTILWEHTKYRRLLFNIVPPKVRFFFGFVSTYPSKGFASTFLTWLKQLAFRTCVKQVICLVVFVCRQKETNQTLMNHANKQTRPPAPRHRGHAYVLQ